MLKITSNLILVILASLAFLLLLELGIKKTHNNKDTYANTQEWQSKYVYRNSHGFRDKEYSYEKPEKVFRILVLGDSQTFGHGIKKLKDTWPKKLEALMNRGFENPRFQIISLSGEGWNADTHLYELYRNGFKYNPDMILLGFYQNDVPSPTFFTCQNEDINFFTQSKSINWFRDNLEIYNFFEFRINRLMEKLNRKPKFTDCINKRFESRGWDMEEIYLDTILMSTQIRNIHFMMTTIPLMYKLESDYPLKKVHLKIKKYCDKKGIECLDLYDKGFKGLKTDQLIVSKADRHLNENATEIVAQTLFNRLKTLKKYEYLPQFSGAFDLNELLEQKNLIKELDHSFPDIENGRNNIKLEFKNESLDIKKENGKIQFLNTIFNSKTPDTYKITLNTKGKFIQSEITLHKKNDSTTYLTINKFFNGRNYITSEVINEKKETLNIEHKEFIGRYSQVNSTAKIKLFKNVNFTDPKSLEKIIFTNSLNFSRNFSKEEMINLINQLIKKNSILATIFKPTDFKNKVNETFDIIFLSQEFLNLYNFGFDNYVLELGEDILKKKPSDDILKSLAIYYWFTNKAELYKRLLKENPELEKNFNLTKTAN